MSLGVALLLESNKPTGGYGKLPLARRSGCQTVKGDTEASPWAQKSRHSGQALSSEALSVVQRMYSRLWMTIHTIALLVYMADLALQRSAPQTVHALIEIIASSSIYNPCTPGSLLRSRKS
jgi:hypothetical protein